MSDFGKALAGFTAGFAGSYAETLKERNTFKREEAAASARDLRAQNMAKMAEQNKLGREKIAREHDEKMVGVRGDKTQETARVTSELTEDRQIAQEGRVLEDQGKKHQMAEDAYFSMVDAKAEEARKLGKSPEEVAWLKLNIYGYNTSKGIDEQEIVKAATALASASVEGEKERRLDNAEAPLTEQESINMHKTYLRAHSSIIINEINTVAGSKMISSPDVEGEDATALGGPQAPQSASGLSDLDQRFQMESNVAAQIQEDITSGMSMKDIKADMKKDGATEAQIDTFISKWETKYGKVGKSGGLKGLFTRGEYKGQG